RDAANAAALARRHGLLRPGRTEGALGRTRPGVRRGAAVPVRGRAVAAGRGRQGMAGPLAAAADAPAAGPRQPPPRPGAGAAAAVCRRTVPEATRRLNRRDEAGPGVRRRPAPTITNPGE